MQFSKETSTAINPLLILSLIAMKETYAYELVKDLDRLSDHTLKLQEGTLYPILKKMKSKELLRSRWKTASSGNRRKYYTLTQTGMVKLLQLRAEWSTANALIEKLRQNDLV